MATVTKLRRDVNRGRATARKTVAQTRPVRRRTRRVARRAGSSAESIGQMVLFGSLIVLGVLVVVSVSALALGEEYPAVRRELESYGLPGRLPAPAREAIAAIPSSHALARLWDQLAHLQDQIRHYIGR